MANERPGPRLRPHVKAFKSTAMAQWLASTYAHESFCCATLAELEGMAAAGLGHDLLLANETLDAERLGALTADRARITVAVDSPETVKVAAQGGVQEVLIDVNVGLPRCGCDPSDAGELARQARDQGLIVRGVMGYEGHVQHWEDRERRLEAVATSMEALAAAHAEVGGDVTSAGGTGTWDLHSWANEVQAGSYLLMDLDYARLGLPFDLALTVSTTVISVSRSGGWFVVDAGLKAFGMDSGPPTIEGGDILFCSDEHATVVPKDSPFPEVGDRLRMSPGHVDPTVAKHQRLHLVQGEGVVEVWPVDLTGW